MKAKSKLSLLLVFILWCDTALGSVTLVSVNRHEKGDSIVALGTGIEDDGSLYTWNGTIGKFCTCQHMCRVHKDCMTFSYNSEDRYCIMVPDSPTSYKLITGPSYYLGYYTDNKEVWVGARVTPHANSIQWGDGTYWQDTELSGKVGAHNLNNVNYPLEYRPSYNQFYAIHGGYKRRIVCQADPTGKGW